MRKLNRLLFAVSAALLVAMTWSAQTPANPLSHVLLISIDGLHAVDLSNYITSHPNSALAALASHGIQYPNALTTAPSDSFPGLTAQVTGATPRSAGVFYDVSYDRSLFPPGSNCVGSPGTVTAV
jgi:predicted AlkP superfamily pyrophosphatase or phosphodiesterase